MTSQTQRDRSGDEKSPAKPSDEMARADVADGERPEQPVSAEHSADERERTGRTGEAQTSGDEAPEGAD